MNKCMNEASSRECKRNGCPTKTNVPGMLVFLWESDYLNVPYNGHISKWQYIDLRSSFGKVGPLIEHDTGGAACTRTSLS